jgi:hypothetical protein
VAVTGVASTDVAGGAGGAGSGCSAGTTSDTSAPFLAAPRDRVPPASHDPAVPVPAIVSSPSHLIDDGGAPDLPSMLPPEQAPSEGVAGVSIQGVPLHPLTHPDSSVFRPFSRGLLPR